MKSVHAIIIDSSLDDGDLLKDSLLRLGVIRTEYFASTELARAAFLSHRQNYSSGILFIKDEPHHEAAAFIKSVMNNIDFSSLQIVLTTIKENPTDLLWAFRIGVVAHLIYPIDHSKLTTIVATMKSRRFKMA